MYCTTINNLRCVFPFIYNGITYKTTNKSTKIETMFVSSIIAALLFQASYVASQSHEALAYAPPEQCTTIYGQRCVFPFTYRGRTYYECTRDNSVNGQPWCAYETYSDGVAIPNRWEDCNRQTCALQEPQGTSRTCYTTSGPDRGSPCIFPFRFQGQTYYSCAQWRWGGYGTGKTWCSTNTDYYGNHINGQGYYGFCDDSCSYFYSHSRVITLEK